MHVLIDGIGGYPYCPEEHPRSIEEGEDGALLVKGDVDYSTVGINSAKAAAQGGVCYDLQGRRVAAPAKGLYIVNGKKVLVK